jgi:DNA polymerase-3 subunit delta'
LPDRFPKVVGQKTAHTVLARAIDSDRLAHAYLLWGGQGVGSWALAMDLAAVVLAPDDPSGQARVRALNHPDLHVAVPTYPAFRPSAEGRDRMAGEEARARAMEQLSQDPYRMLRWDRVPTLSVDQVVEVVRETAKRPFESGAKVAIVHEIEFAREEAANRILKTLEEPRPGRLLILTTSALGEVLPTIVSRCQLVRLVPLRTEEITAALSARGVEQEQADAAARESHGDLGRAIELLDEDETSFVEQAADLTELALRGDVGPVALASKTIADSLGPGGTDRLLSAWTWLLRDVARYMAVGSDATLTYPYLSDRISELSASFGVLRAVAAAVEIVDRARGVLGANVSPSMALAECLLRVGAVVSRS